AGAEPAALVVVEDHSLDRGILAPFEQRGRDRLAHRGGQRVKGFGAVERDAPHRALAADQDVACHGPPLQGEVAACKSQRQGSDSLVAPTRVPWITAATGPAQRSAA